MSFMRSSWFIWLCVTMQNVMDASIWICGDAAVMGKK